MTKRLSGLIAQYEQSECARHERLIKGLAWIGSIAMTGLTVFAVLALMLSLANDAQAQAPVKVPEQTQRLVEVMTERQDKLATLPQGAGIMRMQEIMTAIHTENHDGLDAQTRQAIQSAQTSVAHTTNREFDPQTVLSSQAQAESWQQQALQAYVAALPPRDRARGQSVLLGDGTIPDSQGKLYVFVSRSMPMSLLRAYAMDAMYTGATLVVKGIRKGDTVREYVMEMLEDYNSSDGQVLAGMEINPNLFDMFDIQVVPTVVWTNRGGLDDIGSGCVAPPEFAAPATFVPGPAGNLIPVEKPTCMPVAESAYYKLAGALKLDYVLERFTQAGAPVFAMQTFTDRLSQRHANVYQGGGAVTLGNAMQHLPEEIRLDSLPRHVLEGWQADLAQFNVRRGPYGPAFGNDEADDPVYRQELLAQIRHGLDM